MPEQQVVKLTKSKPKVKGNNKQHNGGHVFDDITNLVIPFGLLLAAHGVGYVSNKMDQKSASKTVHGGAHTNMTPAPANPVKPVKPVKPSKIKPNTLNNTYIKTPPTPDKKRT
jgi:hypothetical protein